jgi:hypothetical protein
LLEKWLQIKIIDQLVNINFKETGPIPNFLKAKEIVKQEMGDGFTQAYESNINRNRKIRAKG